MTVNVSSFCYNDVFPNFDEIINKLINLESDAVCLGLGETVYLSGEENFLYGLQTKTFHKKIIILCRGMKNVFRNNIEINSRLKQLTKFISTKESFPVVRYNQNLKVKVDAKNFYELLKLLENGRDGIVKVKSNPMIQAAQGAEKIPVALKKNFPAIADYLFEYEFEFERMTNYFQQYKKIKLCGIEDENFKAEVQTLADEKIYNVIPTRQVILENCGGVKLYWLDALGSEFCGYIQSQAEKLSLNINIKTARADLPMLTAYNKNFYENWTCKKFDKNGKLDELIHDSETVTYIYAELSIIDKVLEEIKNSLTNGEADKIILTSDHGSSRLAVIYS